MKHLCSLVPYDGHRAGVEICKNYENPLGCKHSKTARTIPDQAMYRHVCDKDAYRPPSGSGIRQKWKPSIKVTGDMFVTCQAGDGVEMKDGVQFQWCDGSIGTLEEVLGKSAPLFRWGGVDLTELEEEDVSALVGKGTYAHWMDVWSGKTE